MSQINTSDQEYRFKEYRGNIQQSRTRYPNTTINPLWNNGSQNRYSYNPTETSTGAPPPPQQQQQAYAQNSFKSYASRNQQASSLNINYNHNHNRNGHYIRHQVVTNGYDNYHNHNHHNHNHNHNHAPISWSNSSGCPGNISNINHAHNYQLGGYRPRHGSSYAASESRHNPLLQYQDVLNGTIDTSTMRIAMFGPVPKGVTLLSSIEAAPIPLGLWESCTGKYKGPYKEETDIGCTDAMKEALQVTHNAILDFSAELKIKNKEIRDLTDKLEKSEAARKKAEAPTKGAIRVKNPMVLVLTIEKYSYEDKGLRCSRHNAARITTLFREKYGYRHVQCYNYKRNKIDVEECGVLWKVNGEDVFEWMRKKRKDLDNAKYDDIDGIIFYISAHGLDNYVAASDDARIKIAEICKIFSNKNCNKKHRGKPRILIVESCRGKKQCEHHGKESFGTMNGDKDGDKGKEGKGKVWTETSDSFIFYATTTGYVAIHDHESGSRYTNIFCDEFAAKKDEGWTLSLMGNHINEKLIAKHKIQTSETYSTLTKPVILVPNNC